MAEDNWWADAPFATAASAKAYGSSGGTSRAKTTPQDMKALTEASARAAAEADAQRDYGDMSRAVPAEQRRCSGA
jgi:hypothetical protein